LEGFVCKGKKINQKSNNFHREKTYQQFLEQLKKAVFLRKINEK